MALVYDPYNKKLIEDMFVTNGRYIKRLKELLQYHCMYDVHNIRFIGYTSGKRVSLDGVEEMDAIGIVFFAKNKKVSQDILIFLNGALAAIRFMEVDHA